MPMAARAFSSISVARGWVEIFCATSAAVAPLPTAVKTSSSSAVSSARLSM